jgi:hypothetical protein
VRCSTSGITCVQTKLFVQPRCFNNAASFHISCYTVERRENHRCWPRSGRPLRSSLWARPSTSVRRRGLRCSGWPATSSEDTWDTQVSSKPRIHTACPSVRRGNGELSGGYHGSLITSLVGWQLRISQPGPCSSKCAVLRRGTVCEPSVSEAAEGRRSGRDPKQRWPAFLRLRGCVRCRRHPEPHAEQIRWGEASPPSSLPSSRAPQCSHPNRVTIKLASDTDMGT